MRLYTQEILRKHNCTSSRASFHTDNLRQTYVMHFILSLIFILFYFTGCAQAPNAPPDDISTDSSRHLWNYDQFDWYNSNDWYPEFILSEAKIDDNLYYQLTHKTLDLKLLIHEDQSILTVEYCGRSAQFEIFTFLSPLASENAGVSLLDITGDGVPELIYEDGGWPENICHFISLDSLTEIPIDLSGCTWLEHIDFTPLEIKDDVLYYRISDQNGPTFEGSIHARDYPQESYEITKGELQRLYVNPGDKHFTYEMGIDIEQITEPRPITTIIGQLTYDAQTNSMVPSQDYTLLPP